MAARKASLERICLLDLDAFEQIGLGTVVTDPRGGVRFAQHDARSRMHGARLSADARWLAWCEVWADNVYVRMQRSGDSTERSVNALGHDAQITFGPDHLAAYGLGSPFPEDSKLCAALSSFWPAV